MRRVDRATARNDILMTLAADTAADSSAFVGEGITVVEWRELPGRRRFTPPSKPFQIITIGNGLVVSCHRDWHDWMRERADALDRSAFLAPANIGEIASLLAGTRQKLAGPHPCYGCSVDSLRAFTPAAAVTLELVKGEALDALRPLDAFRNALAPRPIPARPDMLAAVARAGDEIVACAGASAENDRLWQVGVDVLEPWRGQGVGRAVVARLTEAILDAGKVPYYSHSVSNVPSAALATSLGYWPAWVQWHARESR